MSERRRARAATTVDRVAVDSDDVPECLRAGKCIEVWDPIGHGWNAAWRHHGSALERWRTVNGLQRNADVPWRVVGGAPWSFDYLAVSNPEVLAWQLEHRGLPPDWTPRPAPSEWMDVPR